MQFLRISWAQAQKLCEKLAAKAKGYGPEALVGISRGGLAPTRILSDVLDIPEVGMIRIEFYKSMGVTSGFPRLTQPLQLDIKGKRVLVVDDVSDSGRSLAVAKEHLKRKGAKEVKFATLHFKPGSVFKPDYYIAQTDKWIIYPWEVYETKRELKKK